MKPIINPIMTHLGHTMLMWRTVATDGDRGGWGSTPAGGLFQAMLNALLHCQYPNAIGVKPNRIPTIVERTIDEVDPIHWDQFEPPLPDEKEEK